MSFELVQLVSIKHFQGAFCGFSKFNFLLKKSRHHKYYCEYFYKIKIFCVVS